MTELIDKIRAALNQDERIAIAAARTDDGREGNWTPVGLQSRFDARVDDHIARHDPARVLRQVAAMRKILDIHGLETDPCGGAGLSSEWPCSSALALAEAYGITP
jgi:hypothetical protein